MFRFTRFVLPCAAALVWFYALAATGCAADSDKEKGKEKEQGKEEASLWQTNFAEAKAQAKSENKLLLVDFTGSDWCGWCIKLQEEVFSKKEFQAEAPKKFVLVELDFPRQKKLADDLKQQNDGLAKEYKVRGFPSILVLDAEGQVIARTGYRPNGPEKYVAHLNEIVQAHESIVKMRGQLASAQGPDRAKLLDQLIEAYGKLDNENDEIEAWSKEIVTLDADNKAGLKNKYEYRLLLAESAKLRENQKFNEARVAIDKALALPGLTAEQKQDAYFSQGECSFYLQDFAGIVSSLKKAQEAAPSSEKAPQIQQMLQRFAPIAEAQETVAKLKTELEQAKGLDRAKLLDQLIDARSKLSQFVRDPSQTQDIEKASQEIIALDADNKAGLKAKYQFKSLIDEATKLQRERKLDEAHAVLDKALAIPALTGEQQQEAQFAQGACFMGEQKFDKAMAAFKQAQAAAPNGPRAQAAEAMQGRIESELAKQKSKAEAEAKPQQEQKADEPKTKKASK